MLNEADPEVVLRRMARVFETGGICEQYERLGDHLISFGEIAPVLMDIMPDLDRKSVVRRFVFSARNGGFGWHGLRRTIERLLDFSDVRVPHGMYSLRPSALRVEAHPEFMFARRSVWAQWLRTQGWPIPAELIDAEPVEQSLPALPAPETSVAPVLVAPTPRRRGPRATAGQRVETEMRAFERAALAPMTEEAMAAQFHASRDTCRRAREKVLSIIVDN